MLELAAVIMPDQREKRWRGLSWRVEGAIPSTAGGRPAGSLPAPRWEKNRAGWSTALHLGRELGAQTEAAIVLP